LPREVASQRKANGMIKVPAARAERGASHADSAVAFCRLPILKKNLAFLIVSR